MARELRRHGPKSVCSDSEVIAICLIGKCCGWDPETELLLQIQLHRDKVPIVPEECRFNRRRRQLMLIINQIHRMMRMRIVLSQNPPCVIDSLPIPVVQFRLATYSRGDWPAHRADCDKILSRKATIFGYRLQLITTARGLNLDFPLAPASVNDLTVGHQLPAQHTNRRVIGDKVYFKAPLALHRPPPAKKMRSVHTSARYSDISPLMSLSRMSRA